MANVFMSGFEWNSMYEFDYWTIGYQPSIQSDVVRSGNYALKIYSSPAGGIGIALRGTQNEYYVQYAFRTDGMFGGLGSDLFYWYGSQGDKRIGTLNISESGQIRVYTEDYTAFPYNGVQVLRAMGNARLKINTWYVIEMHLKAHKDLGTIAVRVDGIPDCEYVGPTLDPGSTWTIDAMKWYHWSMYLDDIVVNDATGSFNNSWPGCLKVVLLRPNDDGGHSDWTASLEGHNYDCVNEVPYDATQYVSTQGIDVRDTYGVQDLPEEAGDVLIVRGDAWAFKDSGSAAQNRKLAFSVNTASTDHDSPDQDLFLSYNLTKYSFDYNPETNAAWTKEEVNNILAGIKSRA
jgi:hypothetical protein